MRFSLSCSLPVWWFVGGVVGGKGDKHSPRLSSLIGCLQSPMEQQLRIQEHPQVRHRLLRVPLQKSPLLLIRPQQLQILLLLKQPQQLQPLVLKEPQYLLPSLMIKIFCGTLKPSLCPRRSGTKPRIGRVLHAGRRQQFMMELPRPGQLLGYLTI
jgi:hypothetical protein